ncbi:MAG: hypothetical protein ACREIP_08150, partial [Alphaproteobacteria bacterium]
MWTAIEMVIDSSNYDGWNEASAVMNGLSNLGKLFTYLPIFDPEDGELVAILFLSAYDFADDVGASVADLIG